MARFEKAGYDDRNICEIMLALAVKTLSSDANHIRHTAVDDAFAEFKREPKAT